MYDTLWRLDATALSALLQRGQVSAREAVQAHIDRMHAVNPAINAVVLALEGQALAEADAADQARLAGRPLPPLHGLPITTKINTDQAGCPTDNGLRIFKDLMATVDAPPIASLRRAGAIVIGRSNAPAFSMRAMTDNALHGRTFNPWHPGVTCGGSSGGAGAALAAGVGVLAQGNDIGGSIRWPAYCNGVAGIRPTPGRVAAGNPTATVNRHMSSQLMSVNGPMARSVRDLRPALAAMAARDPRDPLWVPAPLTGEPPERPVRAALVTVVDGIDIDPAAVAAVRRAGVALRAAGYHTEETAPPDMARAAELWHPLGLPDLSVTLRPALRDAGDPGIAAFAGAWFELYGEYDLADYLNALAERDTLVRQWQLFMESFPVIIMPACSEVALPVGLDTDGLEGAARTLAALRFQAMLPVLGLPGLAVPVEPVNDLPMGVQVVSRRYREDLCLDAGEVIEAHAGISTPIDPRPAR